MVESRYISISESTVNAAYEHLLLYIHWYHTGEAFCVVILENYAAYWAFNISVAVLPGQPGSHDTYKRSKGMMSQAKAANCELELCWTQH